MKNILRRLFRNPKAKPVSKTYLMVDKFIASLNPEWYGIGVDELGYIRISIKPNPDDPRYRDAKFSELDFNE